MIQETQFLDQQNNWAITLDRIADYFRAGWDVTVFSEGPGHIAPMPAALGGDPSTWPQLIKYAAYKAGLVRIVIAKAHYLLLPYTMVEYVKQTNHIAVSGVFFYSDAEGATKAPLGPDVAVLIRLSEGTGEAVVRALTELGRPARPATLGDQNGLGDWCFS